MLNLHYIQTFLFEAGVVLFSCVQIGLQEVAQRIEHHSPPEEIFRSVVENAAHLHRNGGRDENLVNGVCSTEGLANVSIFVSIILRNNSRF